MHATRLTARLGALAIALGALACLPARGQTERESNVWPAIVHQTNSAGAVNQWTSAGPLLFGRMLPDGGVSSGLRPLWVQRTDAAGTVRDVSFLYPLFNYSVDENAYRWSILQLVRRSDRRSDKGPAQSNFEASSDFEIWPFWFSRQTGDPEFSYRALFPVAGTLKNKLFWDRATWVAFPLYFQTEKHGIVTTSVPWPIVRVTKGAAEGFGIWPLFEIREQPGRWRRETYLWPLGYNHTTLPEPEAAPGTEPKRSIGALPFYARHTGPGYVDESFVWPFFGYTHRAQPTPYHETRYFWPFLVQGRGEDRFVNRWGPFYTHSVTKGFDKTWYMWPLVRRATWADGDIARSRTQFFYFLYWSERQSSRANPDAAAASLTHVWPVFSNWDNGAGRRQFQAFSPLEVFFPGNEKVRTVWSPLFAIARYEQTAPGTSRTSLLWNAVTWRRDKANGEREFHLGPLFSTSSDPDGRRVAIGNGLVAFRRTPATGWQVRWLDFSSKSVNAAKPSR